MAKKNYPWLNMLQTKSQEKNPIFDIDIELEVESFRHLFGVFGPSKCQLLGRVTKWAYVSIHLMGVPIVGKQNKTDHKYALFETDIPSALLTNSCSKLGKTMAQFSRSNNSSWTYRSFAVRGQAKALGSTKERIQYVS